MKTYDLGEITKKLYDSRLIWFTNKNLEDILGVKSKRTFFSLTEKLAAKKILTKLEKGKFILEGKYISEFLLANLLYQPSYVSFESALNFHGILSQFPMSVTSASPRSSKEKVINGKAYAYSHLSRDLIWGYQQIDGCLMADPEKALCDQLYLAAKGFKNVSFDEYDLSRINKKKLFAYLAVFPKTRQFVKSAQKIYAYFKSNPNPG